MWVHWSGHAPGTWACAHQKVLISSRTVCVNIKCVRPNLIRVTRQGTADERDLQTAAPRAHKMSTTLTPAKRTTGAELRGQKERDVSAVGIAWARVCNPQSPDP